MRRFWLLFSVLLAAAWTPAGAKVRLPAVVGDNMVLQQATDVKVWGWAAPGSEVRVAPSWGPAVRTEADAEGRWCTTLRTPAASFEKRTIRIGDGDGEPVVLRNVLIGEVWLCSGQSNMEIPVQGGRDCPIEHSLEIIAESAQYPDVRLFSVKIDRVNTINVKPKKKRVRYVAGYTRQWKKAVVTLKEGETIEIFGTQA